MADETSDTTKYPVYASKDALMEALKQAAATGDRHALHFLIFRLSNTDTSTFADPTGTVTL